jgi:hypothetical protein
LSQIFTLAQVFWTEAFGSGPKNTSIDGLDTGNGPWDEVAIGSQGSNANSWFASDEECGNAAGTCGSSCSTDGSLHVGSVSIGFCSGGDCGAAYLASSSSKTEKEAISPDINTTGYIGITLSFNYIGYGEGTQDVASWSYSCDGGSTWNFVTNLTTNCCTSGGSATGCTAGICGLLGCQGRWTAYSYSLPSCADNTTNFKIKFAWKNDNDNNGNDPSFAVDDVTLAYMILPVELADFTGEETIQGVTLRWKTLSETNNDHFNIERSFDGKQFISIGELTGGGNTSNATVYNYTDVNVPGSKVYYRLKQVDFNGHFSYSEILFLALSNEPDFYAEQSADELMITTMLENKHDIYYTLFDAAGSCMQTIAAGGETFTSFSLQDMPDGVYILLAKNAAGELLFLHKFMKY